MNKEQSVVDYFYNGFNCAQSVLTAHKDDFDLDEKQLLQVAAAFGAGMGRLQATCGAVTGAYMVIGLKYGKYTKDDDKAGAKTYQLVQDFDAAFKKIHNTTNCKELVNCDLSTDEGQQCFKDNDLKANVCTPCIKTAVKILQDIL